jgi:glycosyltransferase involved in cell wall biosynthesis
MNNKKVAIVIPTFNREVFLQNAIEKSLEQTYPCQIIVCDHGSTDNTPQMMEKYKDKVSYIRREKDFGPHFCWLEGVLNADAEFIHIQYDDDWIEKGFIEKTVALMDEDVGFVFTEAAIFNQKTKEKTKNLNIEDSFSSGIYKINKKELKIIENFMISPGACLYRKKDVIDALYQGNLPVLENYCYHGVGPDHFMSLICLLRYKKIGIITEPLAVFRVHDGSITINAQQDCERKLKIGKAYKAVKIYYKILKLYNKYSNSNILKFISQKMKLIDKI